MLRKIEPFFLICFTNTLKLLTCVGKKINTMMQISVNSQTMYDYLKKCNLNTMREIILKQLPNFFNCSLTC